MKKVLTLCLIHQHPKILLGFKKRGFGAGRWNGFGGKVKDGETIEAAAKREVTEEAGIILKEISLLGIIDFSWQNKLDSLAVYIFKAKDFSGEITESEEMKPQWFDVAEIPFDQMWQDDIHWLPLVLADKKFQGWFVFDDADQVLDHFLEIVEEI